ncbi:MAG: hypothetical protein MI919_27340, partial [Holophagales bacterium]|nr:hypothetical protein [Holophagales bacterium]
RVMAAAGLAVVLAASTLAAQTDPATSATRGELRVGGWNADTEGSLDQVLEYQPDDGGAELGLQLETEAEWGNIFLAAHLRADDDQHHALAFDVRRSLRSTTSYTALPHRLGRDSIDHFTAATNHGRVMEHSDLDPDAAFDIRYDVLEHRTELQPRGAPGVTFGVGYRRQERQGTKQAITVSHCASCHVTSQSRPVDETTEQVGVDLQATWAGGTLRASFDHRELRQGVRSISLLFDDALQPELLVPVFDDRLQWDSAQGPQPVHQAPDITKDMAKLSAAFSDAAGFALQVGGVWSKTENEVTGLAADYEGVAFTAARRLDERWRLRWRARAYGIDNDEVFVDTAEPAGIAGPRRGQTFRQIYGFDPDFLRLSSLDRDVIESRLDAVWKLGSSKRGSIRLQWDHERIDREHFEVAPGETETVENVFGIRWRARPGKGLRLSAGYRRGDVDHPYGVIDGAFSTLISQRVPNPFDPRGAQYYQFQDARIAETTAAPETWDELKLGLTLLRGGNSSFSASLRHWDGDNQSGDLTDWSRTRQSATLSYWLAPSPEWSWNVAFTRHENELTFPISIPIFDG